MKGSAGFVATLQEARLTTDRDAALATVDELRSERETLAAMVQQMEREAGALRQQLQEAQVGAETGRLAAGWVLLRCMLT